MIADPARSRMLAYLLDGSYASASELARAAGVQPSTASGHLAKLGDAGLVAMEPRGRHRYFRLADGEVAYALQALALVAERGRHDQAWAAPARRRLREARCCYGHLAGPLGVALWQALNSEGRLHSQNGDAVLTEAGRSWLAGLDFSFEPPASGARQAYGCLDWSERRDHMAGALGRQLLAHFLAQGWLRRVAPRGQTRGKNSHRALELTPLGRQRLLPLLALSGPTAPSA
jgi:DNA-binding transcriptional ArsR family regulator